MRKIALLNQKGGVGKTTSALNIGVGLARLGKRVVLVDLDPQAHLTASLGLMSAEPAATVYELLRGEIALQDAIREREGVWVVPSTLDLSGAEIELSGVPGREVLLKEALADVEADFLLLDCPPSLGLLTLNALTTADEVFIPLQTEFLALQGMKKLLDTIALVQKRLNPSLQVTGVICTRYDSRKNLNREVAEKIRAHFGERVFKTMIRDNIAIAEAPSFAQSIFGYNPGSYGAEDYLSLSREITGATR